MILSFSMGATCPDEGLHITGTSTARQLLCPLWGGLRFADGQRISLQSLSSCVTALRGSCYRTKTSRCGQPWAIQARGCLSHGEWSWVAQWLLALDTVWSGAHNAASDGDFSAAHDQWSIFCISTGAHAIFTSVALA